MIGQSQVTEPLMTALRTGRIGHAYLFSGPRGCGKTTSARILARCLNCAQGPTDTPCGVCPSCIELGRDGGGSLDVVEIDAASHGGVDDARDLRERAVFAPARDRFKIFIIDEAHMVTAAGFNALLKIVEEPPPHVKFIFATTEPDKVIGTIRSRTHHYPFRLIAPGTLTDYVQGLCDSEGVRVEPGVLQLVVRAGGGSPRDTLSILDQLIAGSDGDTVTAERAAGLLGFTHSELIDDVVVALGAHDAAAAFYATDRVVQTGQDPRRFVEDLLERLRDLIIVNATTVDGAAAVFRGVPEDQLTRMFEQAQAFGRGEISRIADTVSGALDKMTGATAPRLQLELMIARALLVGPVEAAPAGAAGAAGAMAGRAGSAGLQSGAAAQMPARAGASQTAAATPAATPKPDPLAALAAARGAVTQAAPVAPVAAPPAVTAPVVETPAAPNAAAPNAAETAASIRGFLRDDPAGAAETPAVEAPAAQAPTAKAPVPAPQQAPAPPAIVQPETTVPETTVPEAAPPGQAQAPSSEQHPNAGAASFGRPISDILSSAQIAGIGRDDAFKAPAEAPAPVSAAPAAPAPAGVAPAQPVPADSPALGAPGAPVPHVSTDPAGAEPASAEPAVDGASEEFEPEEQPGGFEDLLELWPELLEELQHSNRDAWNAVRVVQPLGLDGDVLTVGLSNESDLAAFKTAGAGPLRETISSAIGLSVKYVPKRVNQAQAPRETGGAATPTPRDPDTTEPHRGSPQPAPAHNSDNPEERAAARLSAFGPPLAAPAWADPIPPMPEDAAQPEATPAPPAAAPGSPVVPAQPVMPEPPVVPAQPEALNQSTVPAQPTVPEQSAAQPTEPQAVDTPEADSYDPGDYGDYADGPSIDPYGDEDPYADTPAAPATQSAVHVTHPVTPAPAPAKRSAPAFTRYGEAVVREVLGARFLEERPLPNQPEA